MSAPLLRFVGIFVNGATVSQGFFFAQGRRKDAGCVLAHGASVGARVFTRCAQVWRKVSGFVRTLSGSPPCFLLFLQSNDEDGGVIAAASSSWLAALMPVKLAVAVVGVVDAQYFTKAFLKGLIRRCLL